MKIGDATVNELINRCDETDCEYGECVFYIGKGVQCPINFIRNLGLEKIELED